MPGPLIRLFHNPFIAAEMIIATLIANLLALAVPIFVMQVLGRYIIHGVDTTLWTLSTGAIIAILFEFAFRQIRGCLASRATSPIDKSASINLFNSALVSQAHIFAQLSNEGRREALTSSEKSRTAYSGPNLCAILDAPFALIFLGAVFVLHAKLGIITTLFIVSLLFTNYVAILSFRVPQRKITAAAIQQGELVSSALVDVDTIRTFNAGNHLLQMWQTISTRLEGQYDKITNRQNILQNLTIAIPAVMSVSIIGIGATFVVAGQLDVNVLIGINILAARACGPIARLASLVQIFSKARQTENIAGDILRLKNERKKGSAIDKLTGKIQFCDIALTYPNSVQPLFESLDLELLPGSVLAVIGPNGSGKTSFVRMLTGLLPPTRGQILIDGVNLHQLVPEWWRSQVAYVPQEPRFLPGTIRQNITLLSDDSSTESLNDAIRSAGLRAFIDQSSDGIDAPIKAGGRELPLGIRRRLALARALLANGKILIVDEPTEGMDSEGAMAVYNIMNRFSNQNSTVIACSHDPNILKGADWVIDLKKKPSPKMTRLKQSVVGREYEPK